MQLRISAMVLGGLLGSVLGVVSADGETLDLDDLPLCVSHDQTIAEIKRGEPTASFVVIGGIEAQRLVRRLNDELVWGEMPPFVGDNAIISTPPQAEGMVRVDLFAQQCSTVTIWGPSTWLERWIGRGV